MAKNWFITGTSRGFGRAWAQAALERGDRVAATARDTTTLADLVDRYGDAVVPMTLDVTDRDAAFAAVAEEHERLSGLDVVVNNAGYGHFGYVEEVTEAEARAQFETNVLGALWITQAAIPLLRAQGSGHILQVSSMGGVVTFPGLGIYHASKWALEGFSDALATELAPTGVRVTIIEPGGYATDWGGASAVRSTPNPVYDAMRQMVAASWANATLPEASASADAILAVVDAEDPPLRLLLNSLAYDTVTGVYRSRLDVWAAWEETSRAAA